LTTRRLFVTGTDTDVGKTVISCALLREAARLGLSTAGIKAAESGCATGPNGVLEPADSNALQRAATTSLEIRQRCPYMFEPAIAPGVAADRLGITIDFDRIRASVLTARAELVLTEGAGGLLCPMGAGRTVLDLLVLLDQPLLVVARNALGTINHTLLTLAQASAKTVPILGIIMNSAHPEESMTLADSNAREIEAYSGHSVLGIVPYGEPVELRRYADLTPLLGASFPDTEPAEQVV